ncbi:hypothetical protein FJZ36_03960 [Candidatus Poribacteria bacterium]|nr:hypothetical protein [Candidatus Poribacteria bacterium]
MTPEMFVVSARVFGSGEATVRGLYNAFIGAFPTWEQRLVWNHRPVGRDEWLGRRSRGEGLLLNADEMAALASFPSPVVRSSLLERARLPHLIAQRDFTRRHHP